MDANRPPVPNSLTPHAHRNRVSWNETADSYQERNGPLLAASGGMAWGVWQIPEAEIQVLGEVCDRDILEFGCGAAQWSIALAKAGARPVGLDLSDRQLEHARSLMIQAGVDFPLVHASAEAVPLPDASFDIVFCDHDRRCERTPRGRHRPRPRLRHQGGVAPGHVPAQLPRGPRPPALTIDLASTICETYGLRKEGAVHHAYTHVRGCDLLLAVAVSTGRRSHGASARG